MKMFEKKILINAKLNSPVEAFFFTDDIFDLFTRRVPKNIFKLCVCQLVQFSKIMSLKRRKNLISLVQMALTSSNTKMSLKYLEKKVIILYNW